MKKLVAIVIFLILVWPNFGWAKTPNDPYAKQWAYEHIKVFEAWEYTTGSKDVVVAVIDNGFDTFHPDLRGNVWKNEDEVPDNKIDDDKNGYVDDVWGWNFVPTDLNDDGEIDAKEELGNNDPRPSLDGLSEEEKSERVYSHGTIVAGLIGAVGDNSRDGVGVNWNVRLMNLKVIGNSGYGTMGSITPAIYYAVDNGADVINISMVGDQESNMTKAIEYAYKKGVTVFAAAGNNSMFLDLDPQYPICVDQGNVEGERILGINAVDIDHRIANFSNFGASAIDLTAPGVGISSTLRYAPALGLKERYGGSFSGTSFASPLAAGTAALIKSLQPNWNAEKIYEVLLANVHHTPGQDEEVYAHLFGAGLLQADKAVKYAWEQKQLNKDWTKILVWSPDSLRVTVKSKDKKGLSRYDLPAVKDIQALAMFTSSTETLYATVRQLNNKYSRISILDKKGNIQESWRVKGSGAYQIFVGDLWSENPGQEIVLIPQFSEKLIFSIYTLTGKELKSWRIPSSHGKMTGNLVRAIGGGKNIVVLFEQGSINWVKEFTSEGLEVTSFKLRTFPSWAGVGAGDVDNDGQNEYVVASGVGSEPEIGWLEADGQIRRKFSVLEPKLTTGLSLLVMDYDEDGTTEAIVSSKNGGEVEVWSFTQERRDRWETLTGVNNLQLVYYN